ncbi:hypothetical protein R6Q59_013672, partial [Mikania micrantha]
MMNWAIADAIASAGADYEWAMKTSFVLKLKLAMKTSFDAKNNNIENILILLGDDLYRIDYLNLLQ